MAYRIAYNLRSQRQNQTVSVTTPMYISYELASFLGKEKGSKISRCEVSHFINNYINDHNLQDKNNRRKINPDAKLKSLLNLNNTDELTYFNIQSFLSPHFFNV